VSALSELKILKILR